MGNFKRAYYYLFYKFYKMPEAAPARWLSDWKAGIVIVVVELWFVYSLFNYYNVLIDKHFEPAKIFFIFIAIIIAAVNYYCFIYEVIWKDYVIKFDKLQYIFTR